MTKKGFDYEECYLTFKGEVFAIAENKKNAKVIGETLIKLFNEKEQLKNENQRLTNKLNNIALELVDNVISQGKAVEISEMSYNEFLDYRAKNGKPMELQL